MNGKQYQNKFTAICARRPEPALNNLKFPSSGMLEICQFHRNDQKCKKSTNSTVAANRVKEQRPGSMVVTGTCRSPCS